jgi:hypothetical protein
MPEALVLNAVVKCDHDGTLSLTASQQWASIGGSPILRKDDPQGRDIGWCPNRGAQIKPCGKSLQVDVGYSTFVNVGGRPAVLASLEGKTDGTPPGVVLYRVRDPGQRFVVVSV